MRKTSILLLLVACLLLTSCGMAKTEYRNPITGESITLATSDKSYIHRNNDFVDEGTYIIGEESQKIILTSLGKTEGDTWRFVNDTIYGGNTRYVASPSKQLFGVAPFYGFSSTSIKDLEESYSKTASSEKERLENEMFASMTKLALNSADIALINGGLYRGMSMQSDDLWIVEDNDTPASLAERLVEIGEEYLVGWYDEELFYEGFLLCVWRNEEGYTNNKDMLIGIWSDEGGYENVLFDKGSTLYNQAVKAYNSLKEKRSQTYAESMGIT